MRTLLLFLAFVPASALAQGDPTQACQSVASVPMPREAAVPKPAVFPACEAYKAYAGIGRPENYEAARTCAWKERAAQQAELPQNSGVGTSWAIGGDLILVNLYANGLGVPRNLPLALHLACEEKSGIAADAIGDLDKLSKAAQPPAKRFDVCDSASSTFSMNFCSGYRTEITAERRNRAIEALAAKWTPEQKAAFAKVKAAEEQYARIHTEELDQGGSIHALRDLGSIEIMHKNFLLDLRQFEKGDLPKGSSADALAAEKQMSAQYQANLTAAGVPLAANDPQTGVTAEGVRKVQAAWEQYRAAWMAFAAVRYPAAPASAFQAYFAAERYRLLAAMCDQIYRE